MTRRPQQSAAGRGCWPRPAAGGGGVRDRLPGKHRQPPHRANSGGAGRPGPVGRPAARRAIRPGHRAGAARRPRLAGHDGDSGRALLRLRHRRRAAGGAGGQLAGRRPGTRMPGMRHAVAGRRPRWRRSRCAGCSTCSACRRNCAGGFVTGATMANFTALAAARHAVLARAGWDVEARRPVRRAADHGRRRRRGACLAC